MKLGGATVTVGGAMLHVESGQLLMFRNLSTFYFSFFLLSLGTFSGRSVTSAAGHQSGVRVQGPEGTCHLTDISKLDGEASINNRKGKLIFFYDWQLRASWLGQ